MWSGLNALKCWHPFTHNSLNRLYEFSVPSIRFRLFRNYFASLQLVIMFPNYVWDNRSPSWQPPHSTLNFQPPESSSLWITDASAKTEAWVKDVTVAVTYPDNYSLGNPLFIHIHLGLGHRGGRSAALHIIWDGVRGMPIRLIATATSSLQRMSQPLSHHFRSLKSFTRGYLEVLCICKAHLIESWWRKGYADVTMLPAGYKGTDFPSCCTGVLSQSDLLWKNQGELKSCHWQCHHVTRSSLRVIPGSCS